MDGGVMVKSALRVRGGAVQAGEAVPPRVVDARVMGAGTPRAMLRRVLRERPRGRGDRERGAR
jgi:hypothetical protein